MRRKNAHKPKRMKRANKRAEPKPMTLAPLPRPVEHHEPAPRFSRSWP